MKLHRMYKYELAQAVGCSPKTFSRWLKKPHHAAELRKLNPDNEYLLPIRAVRYIANEFDIDLSEE